MLVAVPCRGIDRSSSPLSGLPLAPRHSQARGALRGAMQTSQGKDTVDILPLPAPIPLRSGFWGVVRWRGHPIGPACIGLHTYVRFCSAPPASSPHGLTAPGPCRHAHTCKQSGCPIPRSLTTSCVHLELRSLPSLVLPGFGGYGRVAVPAVVHSRRFGLLKIRFNGISPFRPF